MFRVVVDLCIKALDRADYLITIARLGILDRLAGPLPETLADRIRARKAERLITHSPQGRFRRPDATTTLILWRGSDARRFAAGRSSRRVVPRRPVLALRRDGLICTRYIPRARDPQLF